MDILVSTLYYLLFTNSYYILHLYHNTPSVNWNAHAEPTNPTRMLFPFPATSPAKVGTDWKIVRCRSSPCQSCRRKAFGKLPIEAVKSRGTAASIRRDFSGFRWCYHLSFAPHDSLCIFRPITATVGADLPLIGRWRIHSFGSSIRRHHHAWTVTTTTVGLSSAKSV